MNLSLKNLTCLLFTMVISNLSVAQSQPGAGSKKIPLSAANWEFKPGTVEFLEYKSVPAMKVLGNSEPAILKNIDFTNGTIEYDMEPIDPRFTSFYFHRASAAENECFYFRTARAGDKTAVDAIQYAPHVSGVNLWDMLYHFQTTADFKRNTWNHVKLVISGKQMKVYVNSQTTPSLHVTRLEGNVTHGAIAFDGQVIISNLVIKANAVEALSPKAGADPTASDTQYLRKWRVNKPIATGMTDFNDDFLPKVNDTWEPVAAERRGLINLTRKFGKNDVRRIVWLKTSIKSATAQERKLEFGFSDEAWIYLNGKRIYADKNIYLGPSKKEPDGRCTIQNASVKLPLSAGDNELLIGVANDFYGWGIVARLDKITGLTIEK